IEAINNLERETACNTGITFIIAINYGGRDELTRGIRNLALSVEEGRTKASDISEDVISGYLDTSDFPDPDLLIRTSGEQRLSNFLLWQLAYAEFYFTDTMWPDFDKNELIRAIENYTSRDRRFGGIEKQR
ncbi:MAG: di-trans,poly-cis-decaprenylcistransferase, partial [Parasporobacterium sp.]|nr:di-trans,poly-cis-decaprenylcistransferase [Parasporobacterium sp.]